MNLFGKSKASEFDTVQDATLASHGKSITAIVKWCNATNKNIEALYSRNSELSKKLAQTEKTVDALVTEQNKQVALNQDQEDRLKKLEAKQE